MPGEGEDSLGAVEKVVQCPPGVDQARQMMVIVVDLAKSQGVHMLGKEHEFQSGVAHLDTVMQTAPVLGTTYTLRRMSVWAIPSDSIPRARPANVS